TFVALLTRYNRYILPILTAKTPISRLIFGHILDAGHPVNRLIPAFIFGPFPVHFRPISGPLLDI
ncbi:MAG: hypothetical protein JXD22_04220, partial [Sedimentisphaerales bacterium]|nr:hypothetical protein [Sedimentisphaerales bacterium]